MQDSSTGFWCASIIQILNLREREKRESKKERESCKGFYICFWYYQSWKQLTSCVTSQLIRSLALGVLEVLQLAVHDIQLLLYLASCFVSLVQLARLLPSPLLGCSWCCPAPFAWLHPACVCGKGKRASWWGGGHGGDQQLCAVLSLLVLTGF